MKENLEKIGKELLEWCQKYEKEYANLSVLKGDVMGNISTKDKDYKICEIFIPYEEEEK